MPPFFIFFSFTRSAWVLPPAPSILNEPVKKRSLATRSCRVCHQFQGKKNDYESCRLAKSFFDSAHPSFAGNCMKLLVVLRLSETSSRLVSIPEPFVLKNPRRFPRTPDDPEVFKPERCMQPDSHKYYLVAFSNPDATEVT